MSSVLYSKLVTAEEKVKGNKKGSEISLQTFLPLAIKLEELANLDVLAGVKNSVASLGNSVGVLTEYKS